MERIGLKKAFWLVGLPLAVLAAVALLWTASNGYARSMRLQLRTQAQMLAYILVSSEPLSQALAADDRDAMVGELARLDELNPNIEYILLQGQHGQLLAARKGSAYNTEALWDARQLHISHARVAAAHPIQHRQDVELVVNGVPVKVLISLDGRAPFAKYIWPYVVLALLLPGLFLAFGAFVLRLLLERFGSLAEFARGVEKGDFSLALNYQGNDELGQLCLAFTRMSRRLRGTFTHLSDVGSTCAQLSNDADSELVLVENRAQRQLEVLKATRQSVAELNQSMEQNSDHFDLVNCWVVESSQDAQQIGEQNRVVAADLDRLQQSVFSLNSSVELVGGNVVGLARHIETLAQAGSDTETALSSTETALQSVRQLSDNSLDLSARAGREAREGADALVNTLHSITELRSSMDGVRSATSGLTDRLGTVSAFLQAIVDVARRTNLLSLNAAIIASQAGEHGRQFQVVAEEVKALAGQTAGLAHDIEAVLGEIANASSTAHDAVESASVTIAQGLAQTNHATALLRRIIHATDESTEMNKDIAMAMAARESDLERVTHAMDRVVAVTTDIKGISRNQVRAAEGMEGAARTIADVARAVNASADNQVESSARISRALADMSASISAFTQTQSQHLQASSQILAMVEQLHSGAHASQEAVAEVKSALSNIDLHSRDLLEQLVGLGRSKTPSFTRADSDRPTP